MGRSISISGVPRRVLQYLVAGIVVLLALWGVVQVLWLAGVDPLRGPEWVVGFAGIWAGLTVLWVRSAPEDRDGSSWWGPVPSRQYTGRFAEAGGIARDNWEKALPQGQNSEDE